MADVLEVTLGPSIVIEVGGIGVQGPAGVNGFKFLWSTSTTNADPGAGNVRANNATLASATNLYMSETDALTRVLGAVMATWDDSSSAIRGRLTIIDPVTPANFAVFNIIGAITDNGAWDTIPVSLVASGGTLTNGLAVYIAFNATGDIGATGTLSPSSNHAFFGGL